MAQRFKRGDRVQTTGFDIYSGLPEGSRGTVSEVATFSGKSIYPDPAKRLVFVSWDNGGQFGIGKHQIEKLKGN